MTYLYRALFPLPALDYYIVELHCQCTFILIHLSTASICRRVNADLYSYIYDLSIYPLCKYRSTHIAVAIYMYVRSKFAAASGPEVRLLTTVLNKY